MRKIIVSFMIFIVIFFTSCNGNQGKTVENGHPKSVTIGTIRVANDKTVAYKMGYIGDFFKEKGIDVNFVFFDSGTSANVAFASGDLDFATMGYTNGIVALDKDLDVELIWIHEIIGKNEALVVQENSGINKISDLKGNKIATPFSSTSHYSLLKALETEGLHSTDVKLLDMNTEDIMASWLRKDLDAAYTWEPTLSVMEETGKILVDSSEMADKGYMTANIELVSKNFSEKYPDLVTGYLSALSKAVDLYNTNKEEAIKKASDHLGISVDVARKQMEGSKWLTVSEELSYEYLGTEEKPGKFKDVFIDTAKFLLDENKISSLPSEEKVNNFINTKYLESMSN